MAVTSVIGPIDSTNRNNWALRLTDEMLQEMMALENGVTSDGTNMALFSSKDHASATYTRNANLWCKSLVPQFTGTSVAYEWNGWSGLMWGEARQGQMITPRHLIQCGHTPVESKYAGVATKFRFLDANNNIIDRYGVASSQEPKWAYQDDMTVTLLNAAVPASIYVAPIMLLDVNYWYRNIFFEPRKPVTALGVSQGDDSVAGQKRQVYTCHTTDHGSSPSYPSVMTAFPYNVYPGDSGTPRFYLWRGVLHLVHLTGASVLFANSETVLENLALCDSNAVQQGALGAPTGLLPTFVTYP